MSTSTEHDIEFEYKGRSCTARVEVEWKYVDDSFDGHLYGRTHTFEDHHWEPDNWEVIWIEDENGEEVPETPDVLRFISGEVHELEYDE